MSYKKVKISDIGKIVSGATPKTKDVDNYGGSIAWIPPADLSGYTSKYISHGSRNITQKGYDSCSAHLMPRGTVLFSSRAPIGYVAIAENSICTNQGFKSIVPNDDIDSEFLYYQLQYLRKKIQEKGSGTTFKEISGKVLGETDIVVPSLEEQFRIVARIEELFSELDKAVDTLKTTKEQLEVYRQAVLKAAFEGKYTKWWRKNHNVSANEEYCELRKENQVFKDTSGDENELSLNIPDEWMKVRLGEIFDVEVGATPSRQHAEYWNGSIPWVSSGEVRFTTINKTREMITDIGLKNASTNLQPIGTVLLAMIGEGKTRGQSAILNIPAAHNQNTAAILVSKTLCQPKYIYYFLQLNYENTRRVGSGNNQKALNKERVRAIRVPFAPIAEQSIIVKEIEKRLSICENIEQTVNTALAQADTMRQSILKQAFEGKKDVY